MSIAADGRFAAFGDVVWGADAPPMLPRKNFVSRYRGAEREVTIDAMLLPLLHVGASRGYEFEIVVESPINIVRAMRGTRGFLFQFWPGFFSLRGRPGFDRLISKVEQKALLGAAGLAVPETYQVVSNPREVDLSRVRFPAVVKPCFGASSKNVVTDIEDADRLTAAVFAGSRAGVPLLIEQHVTGQHYRILCVAQRMVSCVERRPPNVTGDGRHTIRELIRIRNGEAGRGPHLDPRYPLHHLLVDQTTEALLKRHRYSLDSVLPDGEMVMLQTKIMGRWGADFVDATDDVHRDTVAACEAFAAAFQLPLVGFDFITADIAMACSQMGAFNELNVRNVAFFLGECCNIGKPRAVSAAIWDSVPFDRIARASCPLY